MGAASVTLSVARAAVRPLVDAPSGAFAWKAPKVPMPDLMRETFLGGEPPVTDAAVLAQRLAPPRAF